MVETRPTVLVVGAGVLQVPAIERARARGYRVVAVDRNPNAPGFAFAHVAVPMSTRDVRAVVQLARAEQVDGVLTVGSDAALAAVRAAAGALGLVGPSSHAVDLACDKAAQWALFQKLGGARRRAVSGDSLGEVADAAGAMGSPVVVKPVDGAGGRGSSVVRSAEALGKAVAQALRCSGVGRVLVEEFVEGSDHTAEVLVVDGERCFGVITDKELGPPGLVPREHVVPTALSVEDQEAVWGLVDALCREVGIRQGPLDIDFKMAPEGPELLEFAPRLGGNELPRLLQRATGIDLVDWALDVALGLPVQSAEYAVRPAAVRILFTAWTGLVVEVPEARDEGDQSAEVVWDVAPGDRVREVTCSADRVGYVLAEGATAEEARAQVRSAASRCEGALKVQPGRPGPTE